MERKQEIPEKNHRHAELGLSHVTRAGLKHTAVKYQSSKIRLPNFSLSIQSIPKIHKPSQEKTCFCHKRTTKALIRLRGSAHPCSLISAFVVRCLDSIIPLVSTSKISSLYLASVAAQAGLSTLVANPEDRFSRDEAHTYSCKDMTNNIKINRLLLKLGN